MLSVKRTAFIEQPNGDLVCSITIPAEHRARLLSLDNAEPVAITLPLAPERLHVKTYAERYGPVFAPKTQPGFPLRFVSDLEIDDYGTVAIDVAEPETEDYKIRLERGANGGVIFKPAEEEKPPAQTLNVEGTETSAVMAPENWQHPAKAHFAHIYLHEPFQRFARERQGVTDAFAAPIPTAIALLRATAATATQNAKDIGQPTADSLRGAMTILMDDYNHWCAANGVAPWPTRS